MKALQKIIETLKQKSVKRRKEREKDIQEKMHILKTFAIFDEDKPVLSKFEEILRSTKGNNHLFLKMLRYFTGDGKI